MLYHLVSLLLHPQSYIQQITFLIERSILFTCKLCFHHNCLCLHLLPHMRRISPSQSGTIYTHAQCPMCTHHSVMLCNSFFMRLSSRLVSLLTTRFNHWFKSAQSSRPDFHTRTLLISLRPEELFVFCICVCCRL